ncbi:MAG: 30S ribosomal protein S15 [Brevinemataceae bacterium]
MITAEQKKALIEKYRLHEKDTASTGVQIALVTAYIENLSTHLRQFKKDHKTKRRLLKLVGQRKRLLRYLHSKDLERFHNIVSSLGIRASF